MTYRLRKSILILLTAAALLVAACGGKAGTPAAQTGASAAQTSPGGQTGGKSQPSTAPAASPRSSAAPTAQAPASATRVTAPGAASQPVADKPRRRPLAVMIENHPDARPQSGLDKADIVYEAPAEFGIPRFLAIFVNKDADVLGPVRSARTYFVAWASEYQPFYVHAGGSPMSLSWIRQLNMSDVDALRYAGGGFTRTTDRDPPHNLYTDTAKLRKIVEKDPALKGPAGTWGPIDFSNTPTQGTAPATSVTVDYQNGYNVSYKYDAAKGLYMRDMVGQPHLDRETHKQLSPATVIVQSVRLWKIQGDEKGRLEAQLLGKGDILVFQGGKVIKGTWEKNKRPEPTKFMTQDGKPLLIKPGQVWIQVAPVGDSTVKYK